MSQNTRCPEFSAVCRDRSVFIFAAFHASEYSDLKYLAQREMGSSLKNKWSVILLRMAIRNELRPKNAKLFFKCIKGR